MQNDRLAFQIDGHPVELWDLGHDLNFQFKQFYGHVLAKQWFDEVKFREAAMAYFDRVNQGTASADRFFDNFGPLALWPNLEYRNQWDLAESVAREWEQQRGMRLHKGTLFYFSAVPEVLAGNLERGFLRMHQALEEDRLSTGEILPDRPSLYFATLDVSKGDQAFYDVVAWYARYVGDRLGSYSAVSGVQITTQSFLNALRSEPSLTEPLYLLTYSIARLRELEGSNGESFTAFEDLLRSSVLFDICRVIEAVLGRLRPDVSGTLGTLLLATSEVAGFELSSEAVGHVTALAQSDFQLTVGRLLDPQPDRSQFPKSRAARDALVALLLRNHAGHRAAATLLASRFPEVEQALFNTLFQAVGAISAPRPSPVQRSKKQSKLVPRARGTRDLLPTEARPWERVEAVARDLYRRYGFERIEIPIIEHVELYARGLGESSDAVEKEMFRVSGPTGSGEERAGWALRPEPTAGIVRAVVANGITRLALPIRVTTIGPMFRYDRPQAGRHRQFTQWDVEVIGDPGPAVDAELLELGTRFYGELGISGVVARLNSIGDAECRPKYRQALIDFFAPHADLLSIDARRRLQINPLRVLDDKHLDPMLARIAPKSIDFLCDRCREHFEGLLELLAAIEVPYQLDHTLVRGLDYYTRTAFEFYITGREGQQQALGGGGRYDGLVELLGGPPTPGIGFGIGLDRTVLAMKEQGIESPSPDLVAVVGTGDDLADRLRVATALRDSGLAVRPDGSKRKLGKQLEAAAKSGAVWAVIIGEELARGRVVLRNLSTGHQEEVSVDAVARFISG